ncbi:hypothetical protein HK405_011230 [Cladochytrium tenue]|nr:hypothetical protein HK405_011230 [Cladochytrium tenue]
MLGMDADHTAGKGAGVEGSSTTTSDHTGVDKATHKRPAASGTCSDSNDDGNFGRDGCGGGRHGQRRPPSPTGASDVSPPPAKRARPSPLSQPHAVKPPAKRQLTLSSFFGPPKPSAPPASSPLAPKKQASPALERTAPAIKPGSVDRQPADEEDGDEDVLSKPSSRVGPSRRRVVIEDDDDDVDADKVNPGRNPARATVVIANDEMSVEEDGAYNSLKRQPLASDRSKSQGRLVGDSDDETPDDALVPTSQRARPSSASHSLSMFRSGAGNVGAANPAATEASAGASRLAKVRERFLERFGLTQPDDANDGFDRDGDDMDADDDGDHNDRKVATASSTTGKGRSRAAVGTPGRRGGGAATGVKYTPLELQYLEIRKQHPDCMLIVEVGYKYRFFDEDALAVQLSTGEVIYDTFEDGFMRNELETRLRHIQPAEILLPSDELSRNTEKVVADWCLRGSGEDGVRLERLKNAFGKPADERFLQVLELPNPILVCLGALLHYLKEFGLEGALLLTQSFEPFSTVGHMILSANTLTQLEIFRSELTDAGAGSAAEKDLEKGLARIHYGRCTAPELLGTLVAFQKASSTLPPSAGSQFRSRLLAEALDAPASAAPFVAGFLRCLDHDAARSGNKTGLFADPARFPDIASLKEGSYVPALRARLGIFDAVHTRMGASDDLGRGQSTFMKELEETSSIVRLATRRSLVILDELGRGTSTHDGTAIAYATLRHLVENVRCTTLFVTHYPVLGAAAAQIAAALADEDDGGHSGMQDGARAAGDNEMTGGVTQPRPAAMRLNVARLAGLPGELLVVAAEKSAELEHAHGERRRGDGSWAHFSPIWVPMLRYPSNRQLNPISLRLPPTTYLPPHPPNHNHHTLPPPLPPHCAAAAARALVAATKTPGPSSRVPGGVELAVWGIYRFRGFDSGGIRGRVAVVGGGVGTIGRAGGGGGGGGGARWRRLGGGGCCGGDEGKLSGGGATGGPRDCGALQIGLLCTTHPPADDADGNTTHITHTTTPDTQQQQQQQQPRVLRRDLCPKRAECCRETGPDFHPNAMPPPLPLPLPPPPPPPPPPSRTPSAPHHRSTASTASSSSTTSCGSAWSAGSGQSASWSFFSLGRDLPAGVGVGAAAGGGSRRPSRFVDSDSDGGATAGGSLQSSHPSSPSLPFAVPLPPLVADTHPTPLDPTTNAGYPPQYGGPAASVVRGFVPMPLPQQHGKAPKTKFEVAPSSGAALPFWQQALLRKPEMLGHYTLMRTIGEGEFGKVKLAIDAMSPDAPEVAIKIIKRSSIDTPTRRLKLIREISILKSLDHPHIVKLYDIIEATDCIGLVMEYASGVSYLHSAGVVHRDLKLENLLLDADNNIIITDFGFANRSRSGDVDILMQTSCGSPCYAAPELVISEGYIGEAADIWSCGVVLYAMLCGYLPYDDDPENPDGDNINLLYKYILETSLDFPPHISEDAKSILSRMLVPDPRSRAKMPEVISHK